MFFVGCEAFYGALAMVVELSTESWRGAFFCAMWVGYVQKLELCSCEV